MVDFTQTDTNGVAGAFCSGLAASSTTTQRQATVGGTAGSTGVQTTHNATADTRRHWHFECIVPSGATWASGTWTIRFRVSSGNMSLTWDTAHICRVNSSNVNQATIGSATGLASTPAWTAESDQRSSGFAGSIASAGDVNGDGYGDVIVGASAFDDEQVNEGRAHVYLGTPAGLQRGPAWTGESNQESTSYGASVASAGDVNGDGYGDVVVEAYLHSDGVQLGGRAYVYHGSKDGLATRPAWIARGEAVNAILGYSVASAGDVNGDGFGDVIVGAPQHTGELPNAGRATVHLGSAAGLAPAPVWSADGEESAAFFGGSVASAGDVNGDGYSDVILGGPSFDNGQTDEGHALVHLGSSAGLAAVAAWSTESNQASSMYGYAAATAGDVNGDGFSDVIIGAHAFDNGQSNEGRTFVHLGSANGLAQLAIWTAESDQASAEFGISVSAAGDVNGDGFCDVIVGAVGI